MPAISIAGLASHFRNASHQSDEETIEMLETAAMKLHPFTVKLLIRVV
jgi:hypothetical protein